GRTPCSNSAPPRSRLPPTCSCSSASRRQRRGSARHFSTCCLRRPTSSSAAPACPPPRSLRHWSSSSSQARQPPTRGSTAFSEFRARRASSGTSSPKNGAPSAGAAGERVEVTDNRPPAAELERSALLLLAQDAVDGCPRRPRELGQPLLRERDLGVAVAAAVQLCELAQPPPEPFLGGEVERFEQSIVEPPHLAGQQAHEHVIDPGVAAPEHLELRMAHSVGLRPFERRHRPCPPMPLREEGHFAELVTRSADADHRGVPERRHDPDREPALDDQMERVAGIVAMEDDLVADE